MHVFMFAEGNRNHLEDFLQQLSSIKYRTRSVNGYDVFVRANVREIKLLSVSVPKESVDQLLHDIAPYYSRGGISQKRYTKIIDWAARLLRLDRPPPRKSMSGRIWRKWVNVHLLGVAPDPVIKNQEQL